MLKTLTLASVAGLAIAATAPALADHRYDARGFHKHSHRAPVHVIHQRPVVVYRQPVVVQRPVYVHRPAPVVYHTDPGVGLGILFGAAIGAVIAHHAAH